MSLLSATRKVGLISRQKLRKEYLLISGQSTRSTTDFAQANVFLSSLATPLIKIFTV